MTEAQVEERMALLTGTTDMQTLAEVDLVIEAVFENREVKAAVKAAVQCGYRHIDCASIYKNEHDIACLMSFALR